MKPQTVENRPYAVFVFLTKYLPKPNATASPANTTSAMLTGSGTAVMFRLQPFKVVVSPGTVSAKNSVHGLFGFCPVNALYETGQTI